MSPFLIPVSYFAVLAIMNAQLMPIRSVVAIACLILLAACAATGASNGDQYWQGQIGRISLDDVIRKLGPPESCVGLDNGGKACSWTTFRSKERVDKHVLTFDPKGQLATADMVHF